MHDSTPVASAPNAAFARQEPGALLMKSAYPIISRMAACVVDTEVGVQV